MESKLKVINGVLILIFLALLPEVYSSLSIRRAANTRVVEPEFVEFIESFEKVTGETVKLTITWGDARVMSKHEAGVAYLSASTAYASPIFISKRHWKTYSQKQRELLIWHELAHSVFGSDHNTALHSDLCPVSLMHTHGATVECISKYYESYKQELLVLKRGKGTRADMYKDMGL